MKTSTAGFTTTEIQATERQKRVRLTTRRNKLTWKLEFLAHSHTLYVIFIDIWRHKLPIFYEQRSSQFFDAKMHQ